MTPKQQLWERYYAAIKAGRQQEADLILHQLHAAPVTKNGGQRGGCSKCKKFFR
tara:strand:- start:463 stop:624 length:162 start_codon:yes stop_codon:yes gene_type:complete